MSIFYTVAFWILVVIVIALVVAVINLGLCVLAQDKVSDSMVNYAKAVDEWIKKQAEKH